MEVLATASSIAGVLSLAGQCISGAQNLRRLYQDIVNVSKTVEAFTKDINNLLRSLEDVKALLENIETQAPQLVDEVPLTSLKLQLEDCNDDIGSWLRTAQSTQPTGGKSTRAWFRTFWAAMDKNSVKSVRADMQKSRMEIAVALSTLGRSFDLRLASTTEAIKDELHETHAAAQTILHTTTDANEAILRMEAFSLAISDEIGSMRSLLSACSSASWSSDEAPHSPNISQIRGWRCGQWECLDDLLSTPNTEFGKYGSYIAQQCLFCGHRFFERRGDDREAHFWSTHDGVTCKNKGELFVDLAVFHEHLRYVHKGKIGDWTLYLQKVCRVKRMPGGPEGPYTHFARYDLDRQDSKPKSDAQALISTSWDAHLLEDWVSTRDRINRWILHMLGSEPQNADLHRQMYEMEYGMSPSIRGNTWSRLVLKHWFVDEAATGFDINTIVVEEALERLDNANSSLHLSARLSGTVNYHGAMDDRGRRDQEIRARLVRVRMGDMHPGDRKRRIVMERLIYRGSGRSSRPGSSQSSFSSIDERVCR